MPRKFVALLLIAGALIGFSDAKDDAEKQTKKKGDMTAYYKRTAAKFIAETAKKPGWLSFDNACARVSINLPLLLIRDP